MDPWKWIVWGCDPPLKKLTSSVSSSVARMTGPGTVPLYVHAEKVTPWAISISRSTAARSYRRTRPGECGAQAGIREHIERAGLSGRRNCVSIIAA